MVSLGPGTEPAAVTTPQKIEADFPALVGTTYELTSPVDPRYNCIAWAAGDQDSWWEPVPAMSGPGTMGGYYWPSGLDLVPTLDNYIRAFRKQGYRPCEDGSLEGGYEKVALFADARGRPSHAARQLTNGRWASKLGEWQDIEHDTEHDVSGVSYGTVVVYMRRRRLENMPHPRARNVRA